MADVYRLPEGGATSYAAPTRMRIRRWYESRFLIFGVMFLLLGVGNTVVGTQKLSEYRELVAEGRARGYFPETKASERLVRPLDDQGERYNIARAKVDLYHVVLSGGLLMTGIGLILTIVAWVRWRIRTEAAMVQAVSSAAPGNRH
jgi:hypothetical protein